MSSYLSLSVYAWQCMSVSLTVSLICVIPFCNGTLLEPRALQAYGGKERQSCALSLPLLHGETCLHICPLFCFMPHHACAVGGETVWVGVGVGVRLHVFDCVWVCIRVTSCHRG